MVGQVGFAVAGWLGWDGLGWLSVGLLLVRLVGFGLDGMGWVVVGFSFGGWLVLDWVDGWEKTAVMHMDCIYM